MKILLALLLASVLSACATGGGSARYAGSIYYDSPYTYYPYRSYYYSSWAACPWWSSAYYHGGCSGAYWGPGYAFGRYGYYSPWFYPHYFSVWYAPRYGYPYYGPGYRHYGYGSPRHGHGTPTPLDLRRQEQDLAEIYRHDESAPPFVSDVYHGFSRFNQAPVGMRSPGHTAGGQRSEIAVRSSLGSLPANAGRAERGSTAPAGNRGFRMPAMPDRAAPAARVGSRSAAAPSAAPAVRRSPSPSARSARPISRPAPVARDRGVGATIRPNTSGDRQ